MRVKFSTLRSNVADFEALASWLLDPDRWHHEYYLYRKNDPGSSYSRLRLWWCQGALIIDPEAFGAFTVDDRHLMAFADKVGRWVATILHWDNPPIYPEAPYNINGRN